MALFNYATKEITLKIVYYGPGLSGKTTNLQHLHSTLNPQIRGKLLSLATESDRTLFFDFLPVEIGKIREFSIRFQLYTVPGQVRYNATRKIVLKGADGIVFVADSQLEMAEQNIESFLNMRDNLFSNNIDPDEVPVLFQYNKRDLDNIAGIEQLNRDLNAKNNPFIEACAVKGTGVEESFNLITKLVLKNISKKHNVEIKQSEQEEKSAGEPATPPAARAEAPSPTPDSEVERPAASPPGTERELVSPLAPSEGTAEPKDTAPVELAGAEPRRQISPTDSEAVVEIGKSRHLFTPRKTAEKAGGKTDKLFLEVMEMKRKLSELAESVSALDKKIDAQFKRDRDLTGSMFERVLELLSEIKKAKRKFKFW